MNLHLAGCRRCFDLFRDAAIYTGSLAEKTGEFDTDPGLVEDGLRVAMDPSLSQGMVRKAGAFLAGSPARRPAWYITAAAVITLVMISILWFSQERDRKSNLPATILDPVVAAVTEASSRGSFVLPGGESGVDSGIYVYRSGYIRIDEPLARSLRYLNEVYMGDDPPADAASWLIAGYVATGQIDIARDLAADARRRDIRDIRLDNLEAVIAVLDGDYQKADSIFGEILSSYPDDAPAAINYAISLSNRGRDEAARNILSRVIAADPGSPLAGKARSLISSLESQ